MTISDIKQRLIDEMATREIAGMSYPDLEVYARTLRAIADIPDKSAAEYYADMARLFSSGNCANIGGGNHE